MEKIDIFKGHRNGAWAENGFKKFSRRRITSTKTFRIIVIGSVFKSDKKCQPQPECKYKLREAIMKIFITENLTDCDSDCDFENKCGIENI